MSDFHAGPRDHALVLRRARAAHNSRHSRLVRRVMELRQRPVGDPDGWDRHHALERRVRSLTTGYWIDRDRWSTEVAYARSLEELSFIRRVSNAADDRELTRSTTLRDRRLLFPDVMPTFDDFSVADTRRNMKERLLEHRLRRDLGLVVAAHAMESTAADRYWIRTVYPTLPAAFAEVEVPRGSMWRCPR